MALQDLGNVAFENRAHRLIGAGKDRGVPCIEKATKEMAEYATVDPDGGPAQSRHHSAGPSSLAGGESLRTHSAKPQQ